MGSELVFDWDLLENFLDNLRSTGR